MLKIIYRNLLTETDPKDSSVLIIGRLSNLSKVNFEQFKCKFANRVSEEVYSSALVRLQHSESCHLYLNSAIVAALPIKCSRHNTPSRCHALTRIIHSCCNSNYNNKSIVIVCEYPAVFASGCAAARAFSLFTRKTLNANSHNITVSVEFIVVSSEKDHQEDLVELTSKNLVDLDYAAFGIGLAARITDTPCNEMNVEQFLQEVHNIGTVVKARMLVIRGKQLAEKGFGGIYGVGHAAVEPPALAVLSYTPSGATKTIAWVGKGIVYDTGGLCLKGRLEMPHMKQDCGGAASILGAFYVVCKAEFTQNLHAIFCLAENSIGPLATRPDDIHTLYSGRSVEINNTDAEGRLVLADGVVYAKRVLNATIILDMATLTGSQLIATGKFHAAVLTNCEEWENRCIKAGRASGDLVFPIPYTPELHMSEFESPFADMKNSMTRGNNATTSCAGLFIAAHLGFDFPGVWIHIDMAGTVTNGEKATGYGVALLSTLFGHFCKDSLFKNIAPDIEHESERNSTTEEERKRNSSIEEERKRSSIASA